MSRPVSCGEADHRRRLTTPSVQAICVRRRAAALVLCAAGLLGALGAAQGQETGRGVPLQYTDRSGAPVGGYDRSYALLVGVSDYTAGWPDLESVAGEIAQVERVLQLRGFHVVKHLDPDAREFKLAFEDFIDRYGYEARNRLLFYVSGHGYTLDEGRRGYLVPSDAPDPNRDESGFRRKALAMTRILSWAREMTATHALFLFDSCFSGTIFKTRALPDEPPHIARLTAAPVRQFITAGMAGEEVPARSVFTPAFVDAIEHGLGDLDGDGYVTGMELGVHLQSEVPRHTAQTPQFGKIRDYELSRGDFVFRSGGRTKVASARPVSPEVQPEASGVSGTGVASSEPSQREVAALLGACEAHYEAKRLTTGRGGNAADCYAQVLKRDRGNARALAGLARIAQRYDEWAAGALARGEYAKARRYVERLARVSPEHPRVQGLEEEIARVQEARRKAEQERRRAEAARRAEEARRRAQERRIAELSPEMVPILGGCFQMESPRSEKGRDADERQHRVCKDCDVCPEMVVLPSGSGGRLAIGRFEVTFDEWDACVAAGGCESYRPDDEGWGRGRRPVINVSWYEAMAYVSWLAERTGRAYRLQGEGDWAAVIAADSPAASTKVSAASTGTVPVEHADVGPFGLQGLAANVREWTTECTDKDSRGRCLRRGIRGGGWFDGLAGTTALRQRRSGHPGGRSTGIGFRIVLDY